MTNAETTDSKLDAQTTLLKWILTGVATGVTGLAVFAGTQFTSFMNRSAANEEWLKKDLKASLDKQDKNQEAITKLLERQVLVQENSSKVLEAIRDDQRKFPQVAGERP